MSLQGLDVFYTAAQQQTSSTDLLTVYRTPYEYEQAFVQALVQGKEEFDLASVIQEMDEPEDMFQREERWILAGGDCLFSEFEKPVSEKPVSSSGNIASVTSQWINLFIVWSVFFFMIRFFLSIYP